MKAICNRNALLDAITTVSTVVPSNSPKPVLQCVKIVATKDELEFRGTDLEVGIRYKVIQCQVDQQGETLVSAARLRDIVRESHDETLSLSTDGSELHIRGADSHFKLLTQNPKEFPDIADPETHSVVSIASATLKSLIKKTIFATSKEGTRYAFNGLLMKPDNGKLTLVGTDGRRLAAATGDCNTEKLKAKIANPIVPARTFSISDKMLENDEEEVKISIGTNQIVFETADIRMTANLLEGQFPNYEEVIPKDGDKKMVAGTKDFASAIRRSALLTSHESRGVRMDFSRKTGLTVSSRDPDAGSATIDFACKYDGADIAIGFNPRFIEEALKVIDKEEVTFSMTAPNRPGLIEAGSDHFVICMPVNLM